MTKSWKKRLAQLLVLSIIAILIASPGIRPRDAYADGTIYYAIKTGTKFLTVGANGTVTASATSAGTSAEQFELIDNDGGTYSLRVKSTGKYVTSSGTAALAATATTIGANEKFKRANANDPYLKGANDKYVSVNATTGALTSDQAAQSGTAPSGAAQFLYSQNVTKILEITDNGASDLQDKNVLGTLGNVSIETVSMKRFVALRGDLDGKYDAIYIGKGNYNPTKVIHATQSNNSSLHDTTKLENDITMLKANEIVEQFIRKGQLVFLYNDDTSKSGVMYQGYFNASNVFVPVNGNLYNTFSPYKLAGRENIVFLNAAGLSELKSKFANYATLLSQRPKLVVSGQPQSYLVNPSFLYKAGDQLTFNYNVGNTGAFEPGKLTANLYLGLDQAKAFTTDQIVASSTVTTANGEISFTLPKGYSGLYYWKLEIVDQTSKLRSYETGVIRYRDQLTVVRVLQIMPDSSDGSSLLLSNNMTQSYLTSTNEYRIDITTMKFNAFNTMTKTSKLNGDYDMLIFGFADSYNSAANISSDTADIVNKFIQTGQSVMFTHDTVFASDGATKNTWISKFQPTTGQIDPWTDLGLGAPQTSKTVAKVNDGLLNQFPFNLNNTTPQVAETHNQYFTLDLEDEDVVPWYNITGGTRDPNDSWNHYYTYSKGNVTYSGTGHTSSNFPDWEQKLFVNTMFRAFMGSNHAPMLTVYNPVEYNAATDNFIPSYQDINLSFMPEDYDFNDRNLTVSIAYSYNDGTGAKNVTLPAFTSVSGQTINKTIANPLPNGGDMTITLTATDKTGAKATKTVPVKIKKVSSNLSVKRTLSGVDPNGSSHELVLDRGTTAVMTYTATPKPILKSLALNGTSLSISGIAFNEKLPAGLEVTSSLPSGITKSGDVNAGYTLSGSLGSLSYSLSSDGLNYTATPLSFSITVKPVITGTLPLNNASLSFRDIGQTTATSLPFDTYTINSIVRLDSLGIGDVTLYNKRDGSGNVVKDTATIIPAFTPLDATPNFSWTSSNKAIVSVSSMNNGNGLVTGNAKGNAVITVVDAITGKTASATVTVLDSGLSINGPDQVTVGEAIDLSAVLTKPARETIDADSVKWSVYSPDLGKLTETGLTASLTGLKAGTVSVTLHLTTSYKSSVDGSTITTPYDSPVKTITITDPELSLAPDITLTGNTIYKGDVLPLKAVLSSPLTHLPIVDGSVVSSVTWSLPGTNASIAKLSGIGSLSNTLLAYDAGSTGSISVPIDVTVSLVGRTQPLTKRLTVTIKDRTPNITGPSQVGAGGQLNGIALEWNSAEATPGNINPSWTKTNPIGNISDASTYTQAADGLGVQFFAGRADGGRVTLSVDILMPSGIKFTAKHDITVVNLSASKNLQLTQGQSRDFTKVESNGDATLTILPGDLRGSTLSELQWSTDNSNIATVSSTGVVTAKRKGTTTLTVSYPALGISAKCTITVTNDDKY